MKQIYLSVLFIMLIASSCVSYTGLTKSDNHIFVSGNTSFLGFGSSWIKRCTEKASKNGTPQLFCSDVNMVYLSTQLSNDDILNVIKNHESDFAICFKTYAKEKQEARFILKISLINNGSVTKAQINSQGLDTVDLFNCFQKTIKSMKFPPFYQPQQSNSVKVDLSYTQPLM